MTDKWKRRRAWVHGLLNAGTRTHGSRLVVIFLSVLIVVNVIAVVLESVRSIYDAGRKAFDAFELFSVVVFSLEYLLRLWACTSDPRFHHPFWGRLRYAIKPATLIDLFSVLPFYFQWFIFKDLRFLRVFRLFRFSRILKLGRYSRSMQLIGRVIRDKREELWISLAGTFVLALVASRLMYFAEHKAQPDKFSSIPASMWWGVVTLTTVGYGDVYPITAWGQFLGVIIAISAIGIFAMPAGILASGFAEAMKSEDAAEIKRCPHCDREISGER